MSILSLNQKYLRQGRLLWELTFSDLENCLNKPRSIVAKNSGKEVVGCLSTFDLEAETSSPKKIVSAFKRLVSPAVLAKINVCVGQIFTEEGYISRGIAFNYVPGVF